MPLSHLDHVNIRTANLAVLSRFYAEVLGLAPGPRPAFRFGGAWLYCGDRAAATG
jgi:catechol 2,3-dioxygenase-like lactoylglutathione lyase family enzyme